MLYSRTPLNPYLSVDGSGYGLLGLRGVNFGVNLGLVTAKKYGLLQEVWLTGVRLLSLHSSFQKSRPT